MKKINLLTALIISTLLPTIAFAGEKLVLNEQVKSDIKSSLESQGYNVGKIKIEDGLYEAYAKKDGKRMEVLMNDKLDIVEIKDK